MTGDGGWLDGCGVAGYIAEVVGDVFTAAPEDQEITGRLGSDERWEVCLLYLIDLFGQHPPVPVLSEQERCIFGSPEVVQNVSKVRGNNESGVLKRRVRSKYTPPAHRSPRECGAAMIGHEKGGITQEKAREPTTTWRYSFSSEL